jgi:pyruvate formate lyase activating enzyme
MQPAFVEALLADCKARRLRTVLDTCGLADSTVIRRISEYVDLFLYDLKLMDCERHRHFTGVKNDLILRNLRLLAEQGSGVIVRIPVIPGVNDDAGNMDAFCDFLSSLNLRKVDLLPYHRIGSDKYRRLHLHNQVEDVAAPSTEQMQMLAARLKRAGFGVRIGG